jgi:cytochrome c-type biogenesis protein CcmF
MVARVIGVMGLISVGFLLFTLFTSNPFERLLPAAEPTAATSIPCCRTRAWSSTRPAVHGLCRLLVAFAFAIAALLGAGWTPPGRAGRGPGRPRPGCS